MTQHVFTAGTIFRDETRYLREWVEYHRMIGVTKLVMVNNDDKAESFRASEVLAPYVQSGLVDEIRFLCREPNWQMQAWPRIIAHVGDSTEWLLLTDADAFLFRLRPKPIYQILADYEKPDVAALAVYVCTFGSNGVVHRPKLQTQAFVRRAPIEAECNWTANYILRPAKIEKPSVEFGYCRPRPGCRIIDEDFATVGKGKRPGPQRRLRLNHYSMRSQEDFERKVKRGWPEIEPTWQGPGTVADHKRAMLDRNDVFDDSMSRYWSALRHRMGMKR